MSCAISSPVYDLGHRWRFGNLTIAAAKTGCSDVNLPRFFSLSFMIDRIAKGDRSLALAALGALCRIGALVAEDTNVGQVYRLAEEYAAKPASY